MMCMQWKELTIHNLLKIVFEKGKKVPNNILASEKV